MMNPHVITERKEALKKMKAALLQHVQTLAHEFSDPDALRKANLPDTLKAQEKFYVQGIAYAVTCDLLDGKALKNAFARVSRRHSVKIVDDVAVRDLTRAKTVTNGTNSAIEDVFQALDILERDFDMNYGPLSRVALDQWKKKHPLTDDALQIAYKENQRHWRCEAIKEIKLVLTKAMAAPTPPAGPRP